MINPFRFDDRQWRSHGHIEPVMTLTPAGHTGVVVRDRKAAEPGSAQSFIG